MKKIISTVLAGVCAVGIALFAGAASSDVAFTLSNPNEDPGCTVKVELSVDASVPANSFALSNFTYDTELFTFNGFTDIDPSISSKFFLNSFDDTKEVITLGAMSGSAFESYICSLEFTIAEDAPEGTYPITATPLAKNGSKVLASEVIAGSITVNHVHAMTYSAPVAATCVDEGKTEAWYCTKCECYFADEEGEVELKNLATPIDPDNHTGRTEIRDAKADTCFEDGYTGNTHCLDCGVKLADGEVIPASGTIFTFHEAIGKPGEVIEVKISAESTDPINSIALFELSYDPSILTFVGFSDTEAAADKFFLNAFDTEKGVVTLGLKTAEVFTGDLFTLSFEIAAGIEDCTTEVTMQSLVKNNSKVLNSGAVPAEVTVRNEILGDINHDETVDISDALALFQFSMLPDVYPIPYIGSTDFTKDGTTDISDALLLFQYSMLPDVYPLA
ncbi:MAG: hypothetical protein E7638_00600 [Ruminococcaceae bacterium]|nr:hypothetical protein [Oscillospiraceae bacterium]